MAGKLSITVEIEADSSPITGVLRDARNEIPFVGWIGLAGALERALDGDGTAGPGEPHVNPTERKEP